MKTFIKTVFVLSLLFYIPLLFSGCNKPKNIISPNNYIEIKKDVFKLDEPLLIKTKGQNENWIGLFSENETNPIFWEYLINVNNNNFFDLKTKQKGLYQNGIESLNIGKYSLKVFEKASDGIGQEIDSLNITFTNLNLTKPIYFNYILDNLNDGYAKGTIEVKTTKNLINNASITMFWANKDGILLDYNSLASFPITNEKTIYKIQDYILIPEKATHLHIYTSKNNSLSKNFITFKLPDNCQFKDTSNILHTYTICSDTQLEKDKSHYSINHLEEMFKDIKSQKYKNEGIFINGDVVNNGYEEEYQNLIETYNSFDALPPIFMSIGNHELRFGNSETEIEKLNKLFLKYASLLNDINITSTNYDFWLNGNHFIMIGNNKLNNSDDINLNNNSLLWLDKTIGENYTPNKPTFIFMHQPLKDTVAGSLKNQGWNGVVDNTEKEIRQILSKYPKAILFTSHTHWVLNSFQNIYSSDNMPIIINTGAVAYEWTSYGNTYGKGLHHEGAEGYIMNIYDNKIILRGRDYLKHKWIPSAYYCFKY